MPSSDKRFLTRNQVMEDFPNYWSHFDFEVAGVTPTYFQAIEMVLPINEKRNAIDNAVYKKAGDGSVLLVCPVLTDDDNLDSNYLIQMQTLWNLLNSNVNIELIKDKIAEKALANLATNFVPLSLAIVFNGQQNPAFFFYFPYMRTYGQQLVVKIKADGLVSIAGEDSGAMDLFDDLVGFHSRDPEDVDISNFRRLPIAQVSN